MASIYTTETGLISGHVPRYVARVLKDGVLAWQGRRLYLRHSSAQEAARKKRDRMVEMRETRRP